jgi:hypothetical protein
MDCCGDVRRRVLCGGSSAASQGEVSRSGDAGNQRGTRNQVRESAAVGESRYLDATVTPKDGVADFELQF